jgi:hypothetical protein
MANKYDFVGIKKRSALAVFIALASSPISWVTQGLQGRIFLKVLEYVFNILANKGLIVLNVLHEETTSYWDQIAFEKAFDEAIKKVRESEGPLTPEQVKDIDNEVIRKFDNFAIFGKLRDS